MSERFDRRTFIAATGATLAGAALAQDEKIERPRLTHGPFRADFGPLRFDVWARAPRPGEYVLRVSDPLPQGAGDIHSAVARATADDDLTLRWTIDGVRGEVGAYYASIELDGRSIWTDHEWYAGAPVPRRPNAHVVLGSCADEREFADQPAWRAMLGDFASPDLVVLLGDAPGVDGANLSALRERYRAFYAQRQLAELLSKVPFVATRSDRGGASGDDARRVFLEYHGPGEWGEDGRGVYAHRRIGPIELFLLDTRSFVDTEPSPFDPSKRTLLGAAQLRWLQRALESSDAPFKVLCSSMLWSDPARPEKKDSWSNWPHERDGLFRWLGEKRIRGVVLVSGGIHRARVVNHAKKELVGYDLLELITSPLASTVSDAADEPRSGLLFDVGAASSYLSLSAGPEAGSTLFTAQHMDGSGKELFRIDRYAFTLAAKS